MLQRNPFGELRCKDSTLGCQITAENQNKSILSCSALIKKNSPSKTIMAFRPSNSRTLIIIVE